jgi:hypothetical protein
MLVPTERLRAGLYRNSAGKLMDAAVAARRSAAVEMEGEVWGQNPLLKEGIQVIPNPRVQAAMRKNFRVAVRKKHWAKGACCLAQVA